MREKGSTPSTLSEASSSKCVSEMTTSIGSSLHPDLRPRGLETEALVLVYNMILSQTGGPWLALHRGRLDPPRVARFGPLLRVGS